MDKAVIDYSGLRIKTHDLVGGRLVAGTPWQPSAISSWISWVPEALSSISTSFAPNRLNCSRLSRRRPSAAEEIHPRGSSSQGQPMLHWKRVIVSARWSAIPEPRRF